MPFIVKILLTLLNGLKNEQKLFIITVTLAKIAVKVICFKDEDR